MAHSSKSVERAEMDPVHIDRVINLGLPHVAEKIFKSLGADDLKQCQKVSKTWMVLSEEILAKKILFQQWKQWKGHLLDACKKGKTKIVKLLLDNGDDTDLNAKDDGDYYNRRTPFAWACSNGHEAVAELLMNHPSFEVDKIDGNGKTNLMWASEGGLEQTVKRLLTKLSITDINKRDRYGKTALMYAKNDSIADPLLNVQGIEDDNVDENGKTCLMWASANGLEQTVQKLLSRLSITDINKRDRYGRTALTYAKTDSIAYQLLNVEGIEDDNVDNKGKTCLMWASENGLEKTVKRFLTKLSITDINKKDKDGTTALMFAIRDMNESVADQLLNLEGIDVDSADEYGETCLMLASQQNLDQIVVKLLPKLSPESVKKCDNDDRNAFMQVCYWNCDKVLEVMFANSPMINWDFNAKTIDGATGFSIACEDKNEKAVDLILANYQRLKIDLKIKDEDDKTGMDYWPEKFNGLTIENV